MASAKSMKERITERWIGIRMAEEAAQVADLVDAANINREVVRAHHREFLDKFDDEGSVGNIHIGDVVQPSPDPPVAEVARKKGKGLLLAAAAAACLATGGGAGALLSGMLQSGSGGTTSPPVLPSGDAGYSLGLGEPDTSPGSGDEIRKGEGEH